VKPCLVLADGRRGSNLHGKEGPAMPKRSNPRPQQLRSEAEQIEKSGRAEADKNPKNVAGGKKAAATRKQRGSRSHS
jgi:hypothetical protein